MKDAMRQHYQDIKAMLARCDIAEEDRRDILERVKGLCYRWAEANAVGCVEDELLRERLSTADYNAAIAPRNIAEEIRRRILATYPEEWLDCDLPDAEEPGGIMSKEEMYQ